MMATAAQNEPTARRMDAAEAFQTYPTLKTSVNEFLDPERDDYDVSRLHLELSDTSDGPTVVTVHVPRRSLPE